MIFIFDISIAQQIENGSYVHVLVLKNAFLFIDNIYLVYAVYTVKRPKKWRRPFINRVNNNCVVFVCKAIWYLLQRIGLLWRDTLRNITHGHTPHTQNLQRTKKKITHKKIYPTLLFSKKTWILVTTKYMSLRWVKQQFYSITTTAIQCAGYS